MTAQQWELLKLGVGIVVALAIARWLWRHGDKWQAPWQKE